MPTVRAAVTADLRAVVALWDRAAGPSRHPGGTVAAGRLLARDPEALLVAVEDATIVGTLIVGFGFWSAAGFTVEGDDRRWSRAPADGPTPPAPTS